MRSRSPAVVGVALLALVTTWWIRVPQINTFIEQQAGRRGLIAETQNQMLPRDSPTSGPGSRRAALLTAGLFWADPSLSASAAPFEWTFLWDGEAADRSSKLLGLPVSEVAKILQGDLVDRKYILTGELTPSIFADNCRFVDPNNAVDGVFKYRQALSFLFDPAESTLKVLDLKAIPEERTIEVDYIASGTIKLPWRPKISAWQGHIVYTLGGDGLIMSQVDVWNISRFDALRQTFTPNFG